MRDRWLKPDFQEIDVGGECTAYTGTQKASETASPSTCRGINDQTSSESPLMPHSGGDS